MQLTQNQLYSQNNNINENLLITYIELVFHQICNVPITSNNLYQ